MEDTNTKTNKKTKGNVVSMDVTVADEKCIQEETENVEEIKPKKKKKKSLENEGPEIMGNTVKKSKKRKLSISSPNGEQEFSLKKSKKSKYSEIPT